MVEIVGNSGFDIQAGRSRLHPAEVGQCHQELPRPATIDVEEPHLHHRPAANLADVLLSVNTLDGSGRARTFRSGDQSTAGHCDDPVAGIDRDVDVADRIGAALLSRFYHRFRPRAVAIHLQPASC